MEKDAVGRNSDSPKGTYIWRFLGVRFDEGARCLDVDGRPVSLEAKPLDVLTALLHHAGEVVTKEELASAAWDRHVIDDSVVTKAVGKLRAGLGAGNRDAIKTVHGVGYQLVADVQCEELRSTRVSTLVGVAAGDQPPGREGWQLLSALGDGGYGEAWLAEHDVTGEQRVFKFARDRAGVSSLKREVTIFRLLHKTIGNHPGVHGLLNWNLTTAPYYVEMAYCPAGSLDQWANEHLRMLDRKARLELVARIAEALSSAHSVGVLHKDLKPSNVLIVTSDDAGLQPRITDFGVAEVVDTATFEKMHITQTGFTLKPGEIDSRVGSLMYLAPEILAGGTSTIRSDIYALGVILYQLVVGDLRRPLSGGWQRQIDDPVLRQDIEACVDGDPARRIADAAELATRLRQLENRNAARIQQIDAEKQAVELRLRIERVQRRRHWLVALTVVLALGLGATGVFYLEAKQATSLAQQQSAIARNINEFMLQDMLGEANPELVGNSTITVRAIIDRAALKAAKRFAGSSKLESSLRLSLSRIYQALAAYPESLKQAELAVKAALSDANVDLSIEADARLQEAGVLTKLDKYDATLDRLKWFERDEVRKHLDLSQIFASMRLHCDALIRLGRLGSAQILLSEMESRLDELSESDATNKVGYWQLVGMVQMDQNHFEAAEQSFSRAAAIASEAFGADSIRASSLMLDQATSLHYQEKFSAAEELFHAAYDALIQSVGASHYHSVRAAVLYAKTLDRLGRHAETKQLLDETLGHAAGVLGNEHVLVLVARFHLGQLHMLSGDYEHALDALFKVRDATEQLVGVANYRTHPYRYQQEAGIAEALNGAERWHESIDLLEPLLDTARQGLDAGDPQLASISYFAAVAFLATGQSNRARSEIRLTIDGWQGSNEPANQKRLRELLADLDQMDSP